MLTDAEQVVANVDEHVGVPNPRLKDINAPPLREKRLHPPIDYKAQLKQAKSILSSSIPQDTCITEVFVLDYCSSSLVTRSFDGITPNKIEDIEQCADKEKWREATNAEYQSFMDHITWDLEPLPPGQKLVKGTWVFKIKKDSEGNVQELLRSLKIRFIRRRNVAGELVNPIGLTVNS